MAAAGVAAAFQHIDEADEICVHIGMRIDQRMPHAGLRREMDDEGKTMLGEQGRSGGAVRQVQAHEAEILGAGELAQPRLLQLRIVIGREIVDADHLAARLDETARDMKADEASGAGDEDGVHSRHRSMPSGFCPRLSLDFTSRTMPLSPLSSRVTSGQPSLT